eukprot:TRINITY_DN44836_c0_g1_i1.p1 TRINITY_DN44836_c0_g1~~TRINITY_DN44836_c0_g1_i1.p1  ORF type:complete len:550 (+),score=46.51 TRINITY_DN44836_c0_g1_i1:38-1687(+)
MRIFQDCSSFSNHDVEPNITQHAGCGYVQLDASVSRKPWQDPRIRTAHMDVVQHRQRQPRAPVDPRVGTSSHSPFGLAPIGKDVPIPGDLLALSNCGSAASSRQCTPVNLWCQTPERTPLHPNALGCLLSNMHGGEVFDGELPESAGEDFIRGGRPAHTKDAPHDLESVDTGGESPVQDSTEPVQSPKPFDKVDTNDEPDPLASRKTIPGDFNRLPLQGSFPARLTPQRNDDGLNGGGGMDRLQWLETKSSEAPLATLSSQKLDSYLGSMSPSEMSRSSVSSPLDIERKQRCAETLQCDGGQLSESQRQRDERWRLARDKAFAGGTFGLDTSIVMDNLDKGVHRSGKGLTINDASIHDGQHQFDGIARVAASDDDHRFQQSFSSTDMPDRRSSFFSQSVMNTHTSDRDSERDSQRALYGYRDTVDCQPCVDGLAKTDTYARRSYLSFDHAQDDAEGQKSPNGAMAMGAHREGEDLPGLSTAVASIGTLGHPTSCALPCKFFSSNRGCKEESNCNRCHLCPWRRNCSRTAMPSKTSSWTHEANDVVVRGE